MKLTKLYAVVFSYSFDRDCSVYLFDDLDDARSFLEESYEKELETERITYDYGVRGWIDDDKSYAEITQDNNTCYFQIANSVFTMG